MMRFNISAAILAILLCADAARSDESAPAPAPSTAPATQPAVVCAVVAEAKLRESPLPILLEAKLGEAAELILLDREETNALVQEQALGLIYSPEGGAHRIETGRILKADALVMLRESREDPKSVELIVAETKSGLRLLVRSLQPTQDTEADAALLMGLVRQAVARIGRPITDTVAVPPLVSNDLSLEFDSLRGAYTKMLEQVFAADPNVLVVELAEAQAIGRELALTGGGKVERNLPVYVLGEFRHEGRGDERKVSITLKVSRGDRTIGEESIQKASPDAVADSLREAAHAILQKTVGRELAFPDAAAEAKALAERGELHRRLGNWDDALALLEASLLLNNDQVKVHFDAMDLRTRRIVELSEPTPSEERLRAGFQAALDFWMDGLRHVDYLVRNDALVPPNKLRTIMPWDAGNHILMYLRAPDDLAKKWRAAHGIYLYNLLGPVSDARRQVRDFILRDLAERDPLPPDHNDYANFVTRFAIHSGWFFKDKPNEVVEIQMRILTACRQVKAFETYLHNVFPPDDKDYMHWWEYDGYTTLIDRMAQSEHADLRAHAERMRKLQTHYVPSLRQTLPPATQPNEKIDLKPLQLTCYSPQSFVVNPSGWISCSESLDVIWERRGRHAIYLMREPGKLQQVYSTDVHGDGKGIEFGVHNPSFDGRYVWAPFVDSEPKVAVIDTKTGRVSTFTAEDGLPGMNSGASAAAIGEGKACVFGSFTEDGKRHRAWIALLTLDGRKVEIIHEAKGQFSHFEGTEFTDTGLAFRPGQAITLRDPAAPQLTRIMVNRRWNPEFVMYEMPLLVDPATKQVSDFVDGPDMGEDGPTAAGPVVFWLGVAQDTYTPAITRYRLGEERPQELDLKPRLRTLHAIDGDRIVGIDDEGTWWESRKWGEAFSLLGSPGFSASEFRLVNSSLYGLAIFKPAFDDEPQVYQVNLK